MCKTAFLQRKQMVYQVCSRSRKEVKVAGIEQVRDQAVGEKVISSFLFIFILTPKLLNPNERNHINWWPLLRDKLSNLSCFSPPSYFLPFLSHFPQPNFQFSILIKVTDLLPHPSLSTDALTPTLFREERGQCLYSHVIPLLPTWLKGRLPPPTHLAWPLAPSIVSLLVIPSVSFLNVGVSSQSTLSFSCFVHATALNFHLYFDDFLIYISSSDLLLRSKQ